VLDNTKANRAALVLLQRMCPQWIAIGCTAHSIALIFKDFARAGGVKDRGAPLCPGLKRIYDMLKTISNTGGWTKIGLQCNMALDKVICTMHNGIEQLAMVQLHACCCSADLADSPSCSFLHLT